MAQGTKGQTAAAAAPPNGVTATQPSAPATVNRKKQKRREKQAARQAAEQPPPSDANSRNGHIPHNHIHSGGPVPDYSGPEFDDHGQYDGEEYYSEDEEQMYRGATQNGQYPADYDLHGAEKKSKKKKKARSATQQPPYSIRDGSAPPPPPPPPPQLSTDTFRTVQRGANSKDRIWNTSTSEERERIKEFWLSLGEDDRKSLVKIEKEAVLRKMKEQQKHSCSCTVCGRKRTAIEEELEVLYDAYYEELEQYPIGTREPPDRIPHMSGGREPPRIRELDDSEEEDDDDPDDEDYSDDEEEDDYLSEDEEELPPRGEAASHMFNFGNSLTVKGGILTVADDLLKNDGKKFIEMMEQLAERRMQREEEAQYAAAGVHPGPHSYAKTHPHNHPPPPEEDEYEEEDDEEYDDEEYDDEEEDEVQDTMTEEQRMEEGRRMFQIFAARMFEQRVLTAYREKVAAERQAKLLEELEEDAAREAQRDLKKSKEAQKRKEKKEKQKQIKAEEKARKDAEKADAEAAAKAAEEKKQEEQRRKKEEQRKKKEAERKAQEEEKQRKEAERLQRLREERERQQETERKAREQKAQEKKARDETKKKEREEREAREKDAREKKAQEDKDRRERDIKARVEKERSRKDDPTATLQPTMVKRPNQPVAVALPPGLLSKQSSAGFPSPHVQVATPAISKAPTPVRPRQSSQQGSHGSSPKTPQVAPGTSKSMSPNNATPLAQHSMQPKSILTKQSTAQAQPPLHHPQPASPMPPIGPPPGMQPPGFGIGGMPPGLNGFQHGQPPLNPNMMGPRPPIGHNMPGMYPPGGNQFRQFPPGMHGPPGMPMGRGFPMEGPPGFPPSMSGINTGGQMSGFSIGIPAHSRQQSASFEKPNVEPPIAAPQAQPIARPTPIQRPSSVKPHEGTPENKRTHGPDIDELANHLGSKALLDDADDLVQDISSLDVNGRRSSMQAGGMSRTPSMPFNFPQGQGQARQEPFAPFGTSNGAGSAWSTPSMGGMGFSMPAAPGWGNSPTSGMFNGGFSMMGNQGFSNKARINAIRRMVCNACKGLASRQTSADGYYAIHDVYQQLEALRSPSEPQPTMGDIVEVCDIFGDASNGGGTLETKTSPVDNMERLIKFEDTGMTTPSLGEIGSPIPGHSMPAGSAFGMRPLQSLGPGFPQHY
ncbi:uncharacterized protein BDZ99DRAFT_235781 [Mytilinidion resinicola]|uniref:Stress response protein NST1 n=1 Tax=Mytilinidion resinicola TaxID=574789 RepID=A0A6A6Z0Q9_9PEZI|nr:uncharacterized protein BDZ99DRAFT_235781 [Mytilinidion resinicola]KAF2814378.1 hypothetical protein BDZ99DRAFT_235781 [Mytilinidion resinicola]